MAESTPVRRHAPWLAALGVLLLTPGPGRHAVPDPGPVPGPPLAVHRSPLSAVRSTPCCAVSPTPTPTPTAAPAPSPAPTPTSLEALLTFGPWRSDEALRVARCESGLDPRARNGDHWGLFQIAYSVHREKLVRVTGSDRPELLLDPAVNVAVAALVFVESGGGTWLPWACRP